MPRRFVGETQNVAHLSFDRAALAEPGDITIELDGTTLTLPWPGGQDRIHLRRLGDAWAQAAPLHPSEKNPRRNGNFKDAFRHRVVFVYGTVGDQHETAWALAKARFDAETFWYRGNAVVDVVSDAEFDPQAEPE